MPGDSKDIKEASSPKRLKLDQQVEQKDPEDREGPAGSLHDTLRDLSAFKPDAVLSNNSQRKSICLKGTFTGRKGVGIVLLEKLAFDEQHFKSDRPFSEDCKLQKDFCNDIYGNYNFYPTSEHNGIKTSIVFPATDKHIQKYSSTSVYMVNETPEIYKSVTLPYLQEEQFSLQWVYNILEHKSEADRIVFEDEDPETGFVLLPDMKWKEGSTDTLYLQAIVHKRGIRSIRDLTGDHLPLLQNVLQKGTKAVKQRYGVDGSELRVYLHYQPSFYHLHVHFTRLGGEQPGGWAEKAHLLASVISNLRLLPDYYTRATIPYAVPAAGRLCSALRAAGALPSPV